MKEFKILLGLIILMAESVSAQVTTSIYGEITDTQGEPIMGASVFLEATQLGAQTNLYGDYEIRGVEPGSYNLIASYLGYQTQTKYNIIVRSPVLQSMALTGMHRVRL